MSEISDATAIFAQRRYADGTPTSDWWVIVQHLGEERIYATCPYKQYADDIVKGLRIQAGMAP